MSQNILQVVKNGEPISIILGWERKLQEFFALVLKGDDEDVLLEKEVPDDTENGILLLQQKLTEIGLAVPAAMLDNVAQDKLRPEESNTIRHFNSEGVLLRQVSLSR